MLIGSQIPHLTLSFRTHALLEPYLSFSGLSWESSPRPDITIQLSPTPVMISASSLPILVDR
ncbi:unnamed protein product, partial [Larinioides sclopetarius]